jgi:hypothetical protein
MALGFSLSRLGISGAPLAMVTGAPVPPPDPNELTPYGVTLTNYKTVTNPSTSGTTVGKAVSIRDVTTGKWYFEAMVDNLGTFNPPKIYVGLASRAFNTASTTTTLSNNPESIGINSFSTVATNNGSGSTVTPNVATGTVIRVAFDADAKLAWITVNEGVWNGTGLVTDPENGLRGQSIGSFTSPNIAAAIAITGANNGSRITLRTRSSEFTFAPPAGFQPFA